MNDRLDGLVTMHEYVTENKIDLSTATLSKIGKRAAALVRQTGEEPKGLIIHGRRGPYRVLRYPPEILKQAFAEVRP